MITNKGRQAGRAADRMRVFGQTRFRSLGFVQGYLPKTRKAQLAALTVHACARWTVVEGYSVWTLFAYRTFSFDLDGIRVAACNLVDSPFRTEGCISFESRPGVSQ